METYYFQLSKRTVRSHSAKSAVRSLYGNTATMKAQYNSTYRPNYVIYDILKKEPKQNAFNVIDRLYVNI